MAKTFTPAIDCTNEERPSIALTPIDSRKLNAYGYCPTRQEFVARFTATGPIYHYPDFSQEQFDAFLSAESKGCHFGAHIQILPSKKYSPERAGEMNYEGPDHGEEALAV